MSVTTRRALWWGLRRIVAPLAAFVLLATQLVLPTPVEAATVLYRSAATAVSAGDGVLKIATPEGVEPGDLLLAQIAWPELSSEIASPEGWALLRSDDAGEQLTQALYFRIVSSDEPASHTWAATTELLGVGGIVAYTGVDAANPIADHSGITASPSTGEIAVPAISASLPNSMVVGAFSAAAPGTMTQPAGMSSRWDLPSEDATPLAILLADALVAEPGVDLEAVATLETGDANVGQAVVLNPAAPTTPPEPDEEATPIEPEPVVEPEPADPPPKPPEFLMEFEQAAGDPGAFVASGQGYDIVLDNGEAALTLGNGKNQHEVRMSFRDGNPTPESVGIDEVASATEAPTFTSVGYNNIYPGIDVLYSPDGRELEYSFVVEPEVDPETIVIEFSGTKGLHLDDDGTLIVDSRAGRNLEATPPRSYQQISDLQIPVESSFRLNDDGTVGIAVGDYDSALPLIIDPTFKSVDDAGGSLPDGGTLNLPVPPGVVAGDLLIAQVVYNAGGTATITPSAGWNTIDVVTNVSHPIMQGLYWREATASEPAQYGFTVSSGGSDTASGAIAAYSDVDMSDPIDAYAGQANGTSTSVVAPSITTTQPDTSLVAFFAVRDDGTVTPPAGMTERWDINSAAGVGATGESLAAAAEEQLAAAGPTGTRTATAQASNGSIGHLVALAPAPAVPSPMPGAIWRRSGQSTPFYAAWTGSTFGPILPSQSVGELRILQGAESPSRDEAIVVGVDTGTTIAGERWDGSSWTALPTLGTTDQNYWWSFDVAYESVSGDAIVVYADGANLRYRVWNGSVPWGSEQTISQPLAGTPRQLQLASHPYSDEMVLVVSNSSSQDYALVWDGSAWGNGTPLASDGAGNDRTDVYVAYESQSGDALVVYGKGTDEVYYRLWNGGTWLDEAALPAPTWPLGVTGYARWTTLASDPGTDRIAMGVLTSGGEVWLAVWSGLSWVSREVVAQSATGATHPAVAVAFEGSSGEAIAAYGDGSTTPKYQVWSWATGWQTELGIAGIGAVSNSMMLYPQPASDHIMFAVQDASSDLHYIPWDGDAWGAPNELETNTGDDKNQPFLFLAEGAVGSAPPTYSISGTVFEDVAADMLSDGSIGDAGNPGVAGVEVYLYENSGGAPNVGDPLFLQPGIPNPATTDSSGRYTFAGVPDGEYWVVVDSKTVSPSAYEAGSGPGDVWAEQTYGPAGRVAQTAGASWSIYPSAGEMYGGMRDKGGFGRRSDDASGLMTAEHVARVRTLGGNVADADFGFSYNIVTNVAGGDTTDDDGTATRTVQGSLRQFIQNANAASGANTMRFVPAAGPNASGGGSWWRVSVTNGLPSVQDAQTTIDGTAYDRADGTTIRDTNPAMLGTGGTVGVDGLALAQVPGPELEILGDGVVDTGLGVGADGDNSTVRRVAISEFRYNGLATTGGLTNKLTGVLVEENVLGSGPSAIADPGAGNRQARSLYAYHTEVSGTIRNNFIGFADTTAALMTFSARDLLFEGNEISGAVTAGMAISYSSTQISGDITVRNNLIDGNGDSGLTMYGSYGANVVENNTISNNGATPATSGVNLWGVGNTISRNVVTGNAASGIAIVGQRPTTAPTWSASYDNRISLNTFGSNGGVAIDLVESSDLDTDHFTGDGITLTAGTSSTTGNNGLDAPVISTASVTTVTGTACANCDVEVYKAVGGAGDGAYGEGVEYVGTATADGSGDWSLTGITTLTTSDKVTSLAIDGSNDTSEFGFNAVVVGPIIVNSTGDQSDIVPGNGKCDAGVLNSDNVEACTLRAAIEEANALPGADTIAFAIPTGETGYSNSPVFFNIQLSGPLPTIDETVTIDASTQPEHAVENRPVVVLDGSVLLAGENALSLDVGSDNSEVRGLVFSWIPGDAIFVESADDVTIAGNYVGTDATGTLDEGDTWGIRIRNSDRATIGGTDAVDRNVISGNTYGVLIQMSSADSRIIGNYVGTDATGTVELENRPYGVMITATGTGHVVGGSMPAERNVISGNLTGVFSSGADVTISGNYIGTDADGTGSLGNSFGIALALGATGNTIGGTTPGERNVIAANVGGAGIEIEDPTTNANTITGNFIGVDRLGAPLGNTVGIRVTDGAHSNTIGGTGAGEANTIAHNGSYGVQLRADAGADNAILSNVIHSNGNLGINLGDDNVTANDPGDTDGEPGPNDYLNFPVITSAALVAGKVKVDFDLDVRAGDYRIEFFSNTVADGTGYGEGEAYVDRYLVVAHPGGNASYSTNINGAVGDILTATATEDLGTGYGSTSEFSAAATVARRFVVNSTRDGADADTGDDVCDTGLDNTQLDPECTLRAAIEQANASVGTDTIDFNIPTSELGHIAGPPAYWSIQPATALPTITEAVTIDGFSQPGASPATTTFPNPSDAVFAIELNGTPLAGTGTIGLDVNGGDSTIKGLVVNRFTGVGAHAVWLRGTGRHTLHGNLLGTDITGTAAAGNGGYTLFIDSTFNNIGGAGAGEGNVMSAGATYGVRISGSNNVLRGNLVGTDITGTVAFGHATSGIGVWDGLSITIGGPNAGEGNLISGNNNHGIWFNSSPNLVKVQGNRIGTNLAGTAAVPNNTGVLINSPNTTFGGTEPGAGNLVSGNNGVGVGVASVAVGTKIEGNLIGRNAADSAPLGNGGIGVDVRVGDVTVGGPDPAAANTIAHSGTDNVVVNSGATRVTILGNSIYSSGSGTEDIGIDLDNDGVTANDPGDSDPGSNDLLNFPEIGSAYESGGIVTLSGTFDVPAGNYWFEFFTSTAADGTGYGEGETLVGSTPLTHTGSGSEPWGAAFLGSLGDIITATLTECTDATCTDFDSTSEFSNAVTVTTNLPPVAADDPPAGSYQVTEGGWGQWDVMGNDSDPNGDTLRLQSFTQPSIGTVTRYTNGTPANTSDDYLRYDAPVGPVGPTTFTYTISDGFLTDTATVSINVNAANNTPVFDQDLGDRTDAEGTLISLSAGATDADVGDTLTYSATGLPLGLTIATGSGLIGGLINHAAAASSPHSVQITVCDDGSPSECATDTFTWTITNVVTTPPYLVAGSGGAGGGDDLLTTADETDFDPATNEVDIGIGTGTTGIAATAVEPVSSVLFTADGSQLGILNTDGGTFTRVGSGLGSGDGEYGAIAFDTVVGMSFHPLSGGIWAIHNRPGLIDVMFLIDPATGAYIPDAFGVGVDYRKLRQHAGASEFTSLAMDPTDWQLYGALSDGAGTDYLVSVSRKNGNTKVIGSFAQAITDLSFDNTGQMWAIDSSTLYQVTKTSAALDPGRPIDNGSTYEALAFVVDPASPPALEGTVFEDLAGDALAGSQAVEDLTNPGAGGVTVHIYLDNGAVPGEPDSADTLFDTRLTGPTGHYFFEASPPGAYWLAIDSTSINPIAGGTGWAEQTYGPIGAVTYDGSYQFAPAAGPLFGGKQPTVSDAPADPATSEHVSRLNLAAGDHVEDVDFGFSFDVVTNLEGGDGTGPQGSIRRFINNATTVNGPNAMRFVPAVPTTGSDGGGNTWWHLAPTVALDAITAPDTTVDGTAYSAADGATVVDLNTAGPELELTGSGGGYGLEVAASRAEVRDLTVNGFASGVAFLGGDGSTVAGSYLGPDATGLVGETGNIDEGVLVYGATNTVVGGTTVADRNVISGNRLRGVFIDDATDGSSPISDGTQIVGNYIGTDAAGTAALPYSGGATPTYQQIGIALWGGPDNVIGTATAGNIISANEWHGVYIWGADSTGNKVQGNTIGLDATATSPVPNGYDSSTRSAVNITNATGNLIGGDTLAEGNIIAGNASIGVSVFGTLAIDNAIIGNSIYDNGELGIDLETKGVSANDPGDVDVNVANELLNFPVITSAVETLGTVAVDFELDVPAGDYRIEFFTNSVADPSSHGEGETLTHAYAVMAHPGGLRSYGTTFAGSAGGIVTATTTEDLGTSFGSTSEFSAAVVVTVPDVTPPVITLLGTTPVTVEAGSVYVDAGATAWDDVDGDLTASIVTTNPVDTGILGTYTVTYNVSDSSGNNAAEVTRTVNVVDTTAPVITLLGTTPVTVEAGSVYVDAGATAWDDVDGDLTAAIVTTNPVDTSTLGTYTVRYDVTDAAGNNAAEVTRTVNVVDTTAPVITLVGSTPIDVEAGTVYVDAGATATDSFEGDLTGAIVTVNPVDTSTLGTYTITYNVTDSQSNTAAEVTRTVNVVDTTAPVITLLGSTPIDVEAGSVYVDAGATATDSFEGDLTSSIVTVNPVNTAALGTYTVTYNVTDAAGNNAAEVTRTVNVVDTTAPVITLVGSTPIDVEAGSVYVDAGATATDSFEGDLTGSIFTVNPVNTALVGTYTITYTVSDSTGNAATPVTRIVNVIDTTAPVITLVGSTPIDVEAGTVYIDAGATATDSFEGDLTAAIVTVNPVDTLILGTYTVTYNVTDSQGNNAAEVTRTVNVVDTTAPVITLLGSTPIDVDAGTVYVDAGATATDSFEGDLTAAIFTVNPVNTALVGTYTIAYTVSDSTGNAATPVTRIVNVVDTSAPVITLLGSTPIDVEAGSVYVDAGATAFDAGDGDLTAAIVTVNPVDTLILDTYTVTYNVTDSQGHAATEVTRTVNVVDTTPPVITLLGDNPQIIEAGSPYVEAGATATDVHDGDVTSSIVINSAAVDTGNVGSYPVFYDVMDAAGNLGSAIRTVNVVDTTAPMITLVGSSPIDVEAGTVYVDAGATAWDAGDGDLTAAIITVNPVDTSTLGTYTVTYNVTDSQGHTATEVTRVVNVIDTIPPVITLLGSTPIDVEAGTVYVDAEATANDNLDGDLTGAIVTTNPVDTGVLGTYTVRYNVSDAAGNNAAEVTRTVNVVDTTAPVITLLGSTPIDVEAGTVYVDAGATATDSFEGDLTASIFVVNPVNTALVGTYTITYTVSDSTGNAATPVTRTVNVIDTTAPAITLVGSTPIDVEAGSVYVDAGATAWDSFEGDLTAAIFTVNPVNTALVGTYTITYTVSDSTGNAATPVTRTVNVIDTTAPAITLLGTTPIDVEAGTVYVDAGATAFDDGDGDLTASVVTTNPVDTGILGTYTVRYNVTDSQGNAATEVTRVVNVIDTTPPVITLVGVNPQTIEIGSAYNELGATAWDSGDGDLTSAIVVDASGVDTTTLGTYLVTYEVTDANANAAARVTRAVNIVNAPPTLAPITNRNVTEMTTLTFTANASDPDPTDLLTYSLTTTPSGASGPSIDPTTGVFTWRPTEAQGPGVFTFEILVTDSTGSTDRTSVQISVSEAPRPPVLAGIADATTGEQTAVSFTAIATDPDVPASAVTYDLADAPAGASINSTSGAFLWTPTEAQGPGSYTFNVVATDADGLSDSESVMITVTETNVAPVLQAIPRQSVDEGTTLTFTAVATDRDRPANTLTFALIDPPFGALIDPTTGVVSWTPTEAQGPGIHRFSVTVSDNGMVGPATTNASATQPVTIDVDEANQPPLVERPANRVTAAGVFDAITLEGSDPDIPTQQLTWSATGLPPGLSISSSTGRIAGTPLPAGAGAHQVTITLTDDDGAFGSATFTWTIDQPLPGSPIVKDEFYSVDFGGRLTIPAPGVLDNDRDPDGGTLEAHVYAPTTKGTLDLEVNGSFRYVHDAESSGTDSFTYEVIDDEGLSAYATATITITNRAPVARDDERSVEEDSYVDLDPVAGNDRDPENYELVIVDWTSPRNGNITTPTTDKNTLRYKPDPDYHGLDKFTYTVQDPGGATATATVTVTVTPLNDAPTGVDDSYIIEDYQPAELAVLANDSDVDGDPLRITRVSGAELGIVRILDHRSLSYDPTSGNTGIDTITYTVIDGNGGTTQAKATILIPEAVLAAGEELFDDVAPTNVEISAEETQATTIGGFTIQSVTLMADAFWQTVLALRVPMFFLLLALGSVIVGGGLTNAPIFVAARRKRYYAGVLLHRESFLIAYEEPDTNSDIVYRFQPTARSIHAAGRAQQVDGIDWIPVTTANGKGWIDARHLVQEVDIGTFMEDDRPPQLVADFVERLRSGQSVERLLSRPGLLLALAHDVSFVPASMATRLAARDRTDESWSGAIAAFLSAYDATAEISPKTPHSSVALLPSECQNFLYLALEPDALGRPWLVYIEYLNKNPYIIGLGIDL